jgi:hypothetical protein
MEEAGKELSEAEKAAALRESNLETARQTLHADAAAIENLDVRAKFIDRIPRMALHLVDHGADHIDRGGTKQDSTNDDDSDLP